MPDHPPPLPPPSPQAAQLAQPVDEPYIPVAAVVAYASPELNIRIPPGWLWWTSIIGTIFNAATATLLFLALMTMQSMGWAMLGFLWIFIGTVILFVSLVLGIVYGAIAAANRYPPPATKRRAVMGWLLPLLTAIVFGLMAAGGTSMAQQFNVNFMNARIKPPTPPSTPAVPVGATAMAFTLSNPSPSRLDRLVLTLPDGKAFELGPIVPHGSLQRSIRLTGTGQTTLDCWRHDGKHWQIPLGAAIDQGHTTTPDVQLMLQPAEPGLSH